MPHVEGDPISTPVPKIPVPNNPEPSMLNAPSPPHDPPHSTQPSPAASDMPATGFAEGGPSSVPHPPMVYIYLLTAPITATKAITPPTIKAIEVNELAIAPAFVVHVAVLLNR